MLRNSKVFSSRPESFFLKGVSIKLDIFEAQIHFQSKTKITSGLLHESGSNNIFDRKNT